MALATRKISLAALTIWRCSRISAPKSRLDRTPARDSVGRPTLPRAECSTSHLLSRSYKWPDIDPARRRAADGPRSSAAPPQHRRAPTRCGRCPASPCARRSRTALRARGGSSVSWMRCANREGQTLTRLSAARETDRCQLARAATRLSTLSACNVNMRCTTGPGRVTTPRRRSPSAG